MKKKTFRLQHGYSSLIIDGRRVDLAPGATVRCYPEEIPQGFINQFSLIGIERERLEASTTEEILEEEENKNVISDRFELMHKGGGYYDVVNKETGKPVNDTGLRKEDAKLLIDETYKGQTR